MRRTKLIIFLMLIVSHVAMGQYGNEWINSAQSYFKFKIGKDDFYRITREELQVAGFPVTTVPASRIQLFREGQEVALNMVSNPDGSINYLEFYGQKKDGTSDSSLYDLGDQSHTYHNLFTDSASYFITYKLGAETGKRMTFSSDQNASGLTPEAYHLEDTLQVYTSTYSAGLRFGSGANFSLSKYERGEGWTGSFQTKNAFRDFSFNLSNRLTDVNTRVETVVLGGNSLEHNVAIAAGETTGSLTGIGNVQFFGWGYQFYTNTVPNSSIGGAGDVIIRATAEGFSGASERISIAYMRLIYPQTIAMEANENKVFTLDNQVIRKAWLQIATTNSSNTRVFDITDPYNAVRMATTNFTDRLEVVVPDVSTGNRLVAVTSPRSVGSISSSDLSVIDFSTTDYLIITHQLLRTGGDPVAAYANYRASAEGGGYNVHIANLEDVFDVYGFGDPTPFAIYNMIKDANDQNTIENVFIIGKGYTPNFNYFRGDQTTVNVPTFGFPGGDMMYVVGINAPVEVPGIPIGRLNATDANQVTAYLNKVKEMEALPFDNLFRKDFLQLSGGRSENEINSFISYVNGFTSILEGDYIGGRAFNTGKETNASVEFIDVSGRVNQGVGYITFFGHSSGTVTDIEIGRVSDPEFGFANKARYPIFLVNGCQAGEIFGNNFTFGEDWMLTEDLGAIGFISHTGTAQSSTLRNWSNLYYNIGFGDDVFIGATIGGVLTEVSNQYYAIYGGNNLNLTQMQQMQLQGDPAYRLFGADAPDYHIDDTSVSASSLGGGEILARQDSFKIDIIVKNFGRTVKDSLIVQLNRTFPDGSQEVYVREFLRPLRQDTLVFYVPNDITKINEGVNLFTITVDAENRVLELNETNNTASLEVQVFSGNTVNLYPIDNGTLSNDNVIFLWQSSDQLEDARDFELEIDTRADFTGPNNRSFMITAEVIARESVDFSVFSFPDSTTIYWRTRFANPEPNESNEWVESSFTLIDGVGEGWGQYTKDQVDNNLITGVEYDELFNEWRFIQSTTPFEIFTYGVDNGVLSYDDLKVIIGGIDFLITSNGLDPFCENNTFNAVAFDKESGDPYLPIQTSAIDEFNREVCGRLPQRIYQYREVDMIGAQRRFDVLINNMKVGDPIVMFNIGNINFSNWDAQVLARLNEVGVSNATIASLVDGQPVIFFGRKGDAPGTAVTLINNGSATPVRAQSLELIDEVNGSFTSGRIASRRIGPARDWNAFSYNFTDDVNDTFSLDLLGITPDGETSSILSRARAETIDVTTIDAILFPQLYVTLSFTDEVDQTPPQLNFWEINYSYPPEGILLPDGKEVVSFIEGQEIVRPFRFVNLSNVDFTDSLSVMANLINKNSGAISSSNFKIAAPPAGDTTYFDVKFSSFGKGGFNSLQLEVQANENEAYRSNNRLIMTNLVEVEADETNPILDVTFDGYHILDGDVVSPNPLISIKMRDDNPYLQKTDTTGLNVWLKLPGESSLFERINFSDPRLNYVVASETQDLTIEFQPGQLADGIHALRVQGVDEVGNAAGIEPYEISFEVINASTVTHFYPYPNPFSTSTRFVFTLTGSTIPDQMKIQIMTVSGRIVREITQDEIGAIRIGNNITSYAWDGRDEYGDQLANGVYFYKVFINNSGEALSQRSTAGDKAFKNGFGKLYILR